MSMIQPRRPEKKVKKHNVDLPVSNRLCIKTNGFHLDDMTQLTHREPTIFQTGRDRTLRTLFDIAVVFKDLRQRRKTVERCLSLSFPQPRELEVASQECRQPFFPFLKGPVRARGEIEDIEASQFNRLPVNNNSSAVLFCLKMLRPREVVEKLMRKASQQRRF